MFSGNSVSGDGGGICARSCSNVRISGNTMFKSNSAVNGGSVFVNSSLNLEGNSIFINCSAPQQLVVGECTLVTAQ